MLRTELPSPGVEAAGIAMDKPEMDDVAEGTPTLEKMELLSIWFEGGRRSGNKPLTSVMISDGQRTMKGWTSTVSRGDEMALAGRSAGLTVPRLCLKRARTLSICVRISGGTAVLCCLSAVSKTVVPVLYSIYQLYVISNTCFCALDAIDSKMFRRAASLM